MARPDNIDIIDHHGGRPEFRLEHQGSAIHFIVNHDEEWLDIIFAWSENKGDMKRLINSVIKQLPFNAVRFISPMDEKDGEVVEELRVNLEERGIASSKEEKPHHTPIREVVDYYAEVVDEYYDGQKYEMLLTEWEVS